MSYTIETTYFGAMPNQAEGTLNGQRFYWRARHGAWVLRTAKTSADLHDPDTCQIVANGEDPEAGWWDAEQCRKKLTALLEEHSHGRA